MARVMCVTAHPDDECFAFGGALALASKQGFETRVICMTDGQAASARGDARDGAELGRMRREEFAASCAVLGVTEHELLDYQDGQLLRSPFGEAVDQLVERMRQWRPDLVLSFGHDGGLNTHPDHMVVSMAATAAFHLAGREKHAPELGQVFQPSRLYLLSTNFFLPDRVPPLPSPWSVQLDIETVRETKMAAFRAHRSQAPLMERTRDVFAEHGRYEFYTLAASAEARPVVVEQTLFGGL